ncbi:MAG: hypothetical protein Q4C85_08440 [Actinomyces sp.]|uniref:hypothetical protein n=1 Tax=Actinomyces sp. TaxID=29317 RepID=UPI0026DB695E|nr:hypothetical protein [Actinomyces sp.]MDO4243765.1 hypothetical protein [Actinomyces sp.]
MDSQEGTMAGRRDKIIAFIVSVDGGLTLYQDRIEYRVRRKVERVIPLQSITSVRVESGSALEARVTATRLVALGVFAWAAKKKTGGEVYLTVEAEDAFVTLMVDRKKAAAAHRFVAQVETLRRG